MIEKVLGVINTELHSLDVPYEFMRWSKSVEDRYWVGEFNETPTDSEDGYEEATLILTGTTNGLWSVLLQDREKIEDHFPTVYGLRVTTDKGTVVIFYDNALPVPTGEANLKRLQVNLKIKAWKGMN